MVASNKNILVEKLPHFIAVNYVAMLQATSGEVAAHAGISTFDRLLRLMTIILTSQYAHASEADTIHRVKFAKAMKKLMAEWFSVGDMQRWLDMFNTILVGYEGQAHLLFVPELYHLYWDTSDSFQPVCRKDTRESLQKLTALTNNFKHHKDLPQISSEWEFLAKEIQTHLDNLLSCLDLFSGYDLILVVEAQGYQYRMERHTGIEITIIEKTVRNLQLETDTYYLMDRHNNFLHLNPLVVSWSEQDTAIFDRASKDLDRLRYLLALKGENQDARSDQMERFALLSKSLEDRMEIQKRKANLTWEDVASATESITQKSSQDEFFSEIYLQRSGALNTFEDFIRSDLRCFVLSGKSGVGKSNFVFSLVQEGKNDPALKNVAFLILPASQLDDRGLNEYTKAQFYDFWEISRDPEANIWDDIDTLQKNGDQKLIFVLDAINEHANPAALLIEVNKLLKEYRWIKVVLSTRPEAWERMCNGLKLAESLFFVPAVYERLSEGLPRLCAYQLEVFDRNELAQVYNKYKEHYNLKTEYEDLTIEMREVLRDPLELWIIADSHKNQTIPPSLTQHDIVGKYLDGMVNTHRLSGDDVKLLEKEIIPLLIDGEILSNEITLEMLDKAGNNLLERVLSEGYYSSGERINEPFSRLINAQIVTRRFENATWKIQFKYERFYDYFFGKFLYEKFIESVKKSPAEQHPIYLRFIEAAKSRPFLWGPVQNCLLLSLDAKDGEQMIYSLAQVDDYVVTYTLVSVLKTFSMQNSSRVKHITNHLLQAKEAVGITSQQVALRVALETGNMDLLEQGLLDQNANVQNLAVKYIFYLDQTDPDASTEIVRRAGEHIINRWGIPETKLLRVLFPLVVLLLMDHYHKYQYGHPSAQKLLLILQSILRKITYVEGSGVQRLTGKIARGTLLVLLKQYINNTLKHNLEDMKKDPSQLRTSVNSMEEFGLFYQLPLEQQEKTKKLIPFWNRELPLTAENESDMIELMGSRNSLAGLMAGNIVFARCMRSPEFVHSVYRSVFGKAEGEARYAVAEGIGHNWYSCLERYSEVKPEWLDTLKLLVRTSLENNPYGPGVQQSRIGRYQYYPVMYYVAIWNKIFPGQEVDLLQEYSATIFKKDKNFLLHIIDSLGDRRVSPPDYVSILRTFAEYVNTSDDDIRTHMIKTLARIRSKRPQQVEHFFLEANAPKSLIEEVRRKSFDEPIGDMLFRFGEFYVDFLIYASPETVKKLTDGLTAAAKCNSLDKALEVAIKELLNLIVGK
jgi:hypothetical protein